MSEPTLCDACVMPEDDRQAVGAWCAMTCCPDALTCRDELELYRDGIHAERARVRAILARGTHPLRTSDGYELAGWAYAAILDGTELPAGDEVSAAKGPREGKGG